MRLCVSKLKLKTIGNPTLEQNLKIEIIKYKLYRTTLY